MKNTLLQELIEKRNNLTNYIRSISKKPQLYYYRYGSCIYERLYNNNDSFELTNSESRMSMTEEELIQKGAIKIEY